MAGRWNWLSKPVGGIAVALLLAACLPWAGERPAAGEGEARAGAGNILTGGAIEVTSLDAPPAAAAVAVPPGGIVAVASAAQPQPGKPAPAAVAPGAAIPAENARALADPVVPDPVVTDPVPAPVIAETRKSEAQLACEKRKGIWSDTGGGMASCVLYTRDSGKSCTSSRQCEGQCLARSGTCSPFDPLFGCNEILDDLGRRMTQCLQ